MYGCVSCLSLLYEHVCGFGCVLNVHVCVLCTAKMAGNVASVRTLAAQILEKAKPAAQKEFNDLQVCVM